MNRITGPDYPAWAKPTESDRRARQREFATTVLTWLLMIAVCAGAWGLFVGVTTWVVKCVWEG